MHFVFSALGGSISQNIRDNSDTYVNELFEAKSSSLLFWGSDPQQSK